MDQPSKSCSSSRYGLNPSSHISYARNFPKIKKKHGASCAARKHMQWWKASYTNEAYQAYCNDASHSRTGESFCKRYTKVLAGIMPAVVPSLLKHSVLDSIGQQQLKMQGT